jgi:regulator of cell morphogenesis and NO signaling
LDLGVLEAELEAVVALGLPDAVPEETGALIDLIETRFHAGHRRELPELLRLARRTEAAHRAHALAPHGIAALLGHIQEELEAHMQKEEQVLFPMMRRGGHPMIGQPIAVLLAEHDGHGAQLRALERVAHGFEPLEEACPTWRALYVGARRLSEEVMEHIHLENNVLFPRFAA